jgi:hypothetical protein
VVCESLVRVVFVALAVSGCGAAARSWLNVVTTDATKYGTDPWHEPEPPHFRADHEQHLGDREGQRSPSDNFGGRPSEPAPVP